MRKGFWDRHGANNANCYKGIHGEELFRSPKSDFFREFSAVLQPFYQKRIKVMLLIRGQCKFMFKQ